MKFNDIEDKLDTLEVTVELLGYSIESELDYLVSTDQWLDAYYIITTTSIYQLFFFISKDKEIKGTHAISECRIKLTSEYLKSVDDPTEDQIDEVISCLIAKIGDD